MVLDNLFLFTLAPWLAIFIISFVITLFVTLVYRFATNQKRMKELKDEQKKLQAKYKKSMKDPEKAMAIQKELMAKNMEYTKASFKSTFYTLLPLLIIFAWMHAHFAFVNIAPDDVFTTTMTFEAGATGVVTIYPTEQLELLSSAEKPVNGTVQWELTGPEGFHAITYEYNNEQYTLDLVITDDWMYKDPVLDKNKGGFLGIGGKTNVISEESKINSIAIDLKPTRPFGSFKFLGMEPGWLATYIIFSLVLSILLRKVMKIY